MNQTHIVKILAYWPKRVFLILKFRAFHFDHRLKLWHFSFLYNNEDKTSKNR